jgi:hypothetical protein
MGSGKARLCLSAMHESVNMMARRPWRRLTLDHLPGTPTRAWCPGCRLKTRTAKEYPLTSV